MKHFDSIKKAVCLVIIVVSVIAMIILVADYVKDKNNTPEETAVKTEIATLKPKEDKTQITISTETIQDGLSNMGFLITQEYYFTQVETYTKEKQILGIASSSEFVYSYDGAVTAGIDFEKISVSKDDTNKTIKVKLPESEIQAVTIDKDTFKVYEEKESLWNSFKLEDYNMSLAQFEKSARQKALDSGILDRSDEQAKTLVQSFIKNFSQISGYEIEFE